MGLWVVWWWLHKLQKWLTASGVNCRSLSEANIFIWPCWLNSHLRMAIVERLSAICTGKISGHLEWTSTTTKTLQPLIGQAKSICIRNHGCPDRLDQKTGVSVATAWVQRPRSSVKTVEKRFMVSSLCFVMALWSGDLETTLSGMYRRTSDSIKPRPNWLCLESFRTLFCPQFRLLLAILQWCGHNSQMHHSLHVLSVFPIVSMRWGLCPRQCLSVTGQSGRSVLLTYFRFDLVLRRKVVTWQFVCFFAVCVCYAVTCMLFWAPMGCRISLYVLAFFIRDSGVSWMDAFRQNANQLNFRMQMVAFYVLNLVTLGYVFVLKIPQYTVSGDNFDIFRSVWSLTPPPF